MYIKRTVENVIDETSKSFPCIVIYGARQVGKSTTVDHLFGERYQYVTLDDADDQMLAISNPKLFLETYAWPLVIDEIQKAPELMGEIKKKIDSQRLIWTRENKKRELMYILTGSNRFELQQGISESLAGRCGIIDMSSFSQVEKYGEEGHLFDPSIKALLANEKRTKIKYRTRAQIYSDIFTGGMPDIVTGNSDREQYYRAYVSTYIEKDVRKLISASSETQFRNFVSLAALRTAQELHYDEIAGNAGIDVRTCKRWISILETAGIIYLLQPYMSNISSRVIKSPKLYFLDTGLCAYLCKWPNPEMLEKCAMSGAFFETYVVSEMVKNFYAYNKDPKESLFYFLYKDQKEIDLLYVSQGKVFPIEIKKSISPVKATKNFDVLSKYRLDIQPGLVIDNCDKIRPINEKAYYYPVYMLGD